MIIKFLITLIVSILNFVLGYIIWRKNYKNPSNFFYFAMCASAGLWSLAMTFLLIVRDLFLLEEVIVPATYLFGTLPPLFYLLFCYHFPSKLKRYPKATISLIYSISFILIFLILTKILTMEEIELFGNGIKQQSVFPNLLLYSIYFFGYILWGFIILWKKLINNSYFNYRHQIKYLMVAIISTFIVIGTVSILIPLVYSFALDWLGPIFLLIHLIFIGNFLFIKSLKTNG